MDKFIPLDIPLNEFLELAEKDPLRLFSLIKAIIEDEVRQVHGITTYKKFLDLKDMDIIVEFFIKCYIGEISAKVIYSKNPIQALIKYYSHERNTCSSEETHP